MPSMPTLAPTLTPESNRFKRPWKDSSRGLRVPLWTPLAEGQWLDGKIEVPNRLVGTAEHTNERLEFNSLIQQNINRWVAWREMRGWYITTKPHVRGPFDPPGSDEGKSRQFTLRAEQVLGKSRSLRPITSFSHTEEMKWYFVRARFKRNEPLYARLDDFLQMKDLETAYGVSPDEDFLPENQLGDTAAVIDVDGGLDPMVVAAERRARLGLNRSDYLMGRLEDPL